MKVNQLQTLGNRSHPMVKTGVSVKFDGSPLQALVAMTSMTYLDPCPIVGSPVNKATPAVDESCSLLFPPVAAKPAHSK